MQVLTQSEALAARARGITLAGPLLADTSPQARSGGCTAEAFTIDWEHHQATCPQAGHQHRVESVPPNGEPRRPWSGSPRPPARHARPRTLCTRSSRSGRWLSPRPREVHDAVVAARAGQNSQQWKDRYKIRAGVEGTIRQATHVPASAALAPPASPAPRVTQPPPVPTTPRNTGPTVEPGAHPSALGHPATPATAFPHHYMTHRAGAR